MSISDTFSYSYLSIAATALALYLVVGVIYRLYLSPISKFPGPKLAALTLWYARTSREDQTLGG
jgi:hypothetical protein